MQSLQTLKEKRQTQQVNIIEIDLMPYFRFSGEPCFLIISKCTPCYDGDYGDNDDKTQIINTRNSKYHIKHNSLKEM